MNEYLEFLKIAQQRYESQHNVLWKVEVHYTWFVYIIAGALVLIILNQDKIPTSNIWIFFIIVSLLGLVLSLIGYYVLRKEGQYLWETRQIYARTLGKLDDIRQLHPTPNWKIQGWKTLRQQANKCFFLLLASAIISILSCLLAIFSDSKGRILGKVGLNRSTIRIFLRNRFGNKVIKLLCRKSRLTVRDAFQITLLLAALLFILAMIFSPELINC